MSLDDLLPAVRSLTYAQKADLLRFLADELAATGAAVPPAGEGAVDPFPLRGSVLWYDRPLDPVIESPEPEEAR